MILNAWYPSFYTSNISNFFSFWDITSLVFFASSSSPFVDATSIFHGELIVHALTLTSFLSVVFTLRLLHWLWTNPRYNSFSSSSSSFSYIFVGKHRHALCFDSFDSLSSMSNWVSAKLYLRVSSTLHLLDFIHVMASMEEASSSLGSENYLYSESQILDSNLDQPVPSIFYLISHTRVMFTVNSILFEFKYHIF